MVRQKEKDFDLLTINDVWEHFVCHFRQLTVCFRVIWLFDLSDISIFVNDEDFTLGNIHIDVTNSISLPITKSAVEWSLIWREEIHYILQAGNLKDLWLP